MAGRPTIQDRPRCFGCSQEVAIADAVFAAPCGHAGCSSVVWHGLHLMEYREKVGDKPHVVVWPINRNA